MTSTIYILGVIVWMLFSTLANLRNRDYDTGVIALSVILASLLWPISLVWFLIGSTLKWGREQ